MDEILYGFILPSKGKIYDDVKEDFDGVVQMSSMTVSHEMKRLTKTDKQYQVLSEIIDDCIKTDIGISSYDMALPDFEACLFALRIATYGDTYPVSSICDGCGVVNQDEISLLDFPVTFFGDVDISDLLDFDLPVTKKHVQLNVLTPRMMDSVTVQSKEAERKYGAKKDWNMLYTLKSMIASIDYEKPNAFLIEQQLETLPMRDMLTIQQKSGKLNSSFGKDTTLHIVCEKCGKEYDSPFRFTNEFFRPTVLD